MIGYYVLKAYGGNDDIVNKKGTIIKKDGNDRYAIEFDEKIRNGHRSIHFILGITAPGKDGHCWNFWSSDEGPITDYLRKN